LAERRSEGRYTEETSQNVDTDERDIEKNGEVFERRNHCGNVNG
jgi:hypothetical protein